MESEGLNKALYWALGGGCVLLTLLWGIFRLWAEKP